MTRILTDGAEMGDLRLWTDPGAVTIDSGSKRSGVYSYKNENWGYFTTPNLSEFYARIGTAGNWTLSTTITVRKGSTVIGSISRNSVTQRLEIRVGSTIVVTGNIQVPTNAWVSVEWHLKIADSGGVSEIKIDGTVDASYSGNTKPDANTNIDNFYFAANSGYTGLQYLDDIAINDINGSVDNSWTGDGHIIIRKSNGNGDASDLVGQDGNSVDNYLNVDEVPLDSDTTYNESATVDAKDLYNIEDFSGSGITILRVWVEARARDTVADAGLCQVGFKTSGSEYWSSDISLYTTYIKRVMSSMYEVNPYDSLPWEDSDLDAIQIGFKAR